LTELILGGVAARLREGIREAGPVPFARFMEAALYDPAGGFYATGGRAGGRGGQFLTSPEVGPLFGAVLARALDTWWDELGRPHPFTVVDAGAGPGTLARAVLAAAPACDAAGALRYVMSERSSSQRAAHAGVRAESTSNRWPSAFVGVVVANELLDNLPFRLAVFDGGWREAFVDVAPDGRLVEVLHPFDEVPPCLPDVAPLGARAPVQDEAAAWVVAGLERLERGRLVVIDYTRTTVDMAGRPWREWLRTYRDHERGGHYLADPGSQDITADVALDQLPRPSHVGRQADFLRAHGLDELVEEGRARWRAGASAPDLAALAGRSRVSEAEALVDPGGLGAFTVAEWEVGQGPPPG
jgi:SAM-dependent MidA family methyltransferase